MLLMWPVVVHSLVADNFCSHNVIDTWLSRMERLAQPLQFVDEVVEDSASSAT